MHMPHTGESSSRHFTDKAIRSIQLGYPALQFLPNGKMSSLPSQGFAKLNQSTRPTGYSTFACYAS
jgi:hypothetical protein